MAWDFNPDEITHGLGQFASSAFWLLSRVSLVSGIVAGNLATGAIFGFTAPTLLIIAGLLFAGSYAISYMLRDTIVAEHFKKEGKHYAPHFPLLGLGVRQQTSTLPISLGIFL